MPYSIILFDLDGTLTDSAEGIVNSVVYALERKGIPYTSKSDLRRFVGPPLVDSFKDHCGFSDEQAKEMVSIFREYFTSKGIFENSVYDGVPQMLDTLLGAGCTLAVATSKPEEFAVQILTRFDIAKYFSVIAGASMDGGTKPMVIRKALDRLEIKPSEKILMVGDREHDVLGAKEVGIDSLGVLYGYGSEAELCSAGASLIAATPAEVADAVTK